MTVSLGTFVQDIANFGFFVRSVDCDAVQTPSYFKPVAFVSKNRYDVPGILSKFTGFLSFGETATFTVSDSRGSEGTFKIWYEGTNDGSGYSSTLKWETSASLDTVLKDRHDYTA